MARNSFCLCSKVLKIRARRSHRSFNSQWAGYDFPSCQLSEKIFQEEEEGVGWQWLKSWAERTEIIWPPDGLEPFRHGSHQGRCGESNVRWLEGLEPCSKSGSSAAQRRCELPGIHDLLPSDCHRLQTAYQIPSPTLCSGNFEQEGRENYIMALFPGGNQPSTTVHSTPVL